MHLKAVSIGAVGLLVALCACAVNSTENPSGDVETPAVGERGGICGGIAGLACRAAADYCAYEPGQCVEIADAAGVCKRRPQVCTMEYAPVCGCDGQTYSNRCRAAATGVSVAYDGECPPPKEQN